MGALSPAHWAVIAVVLLVLFGSKKLPEAARGLGRSLRILKTEVAELHTDEPTPADHALTSPTPKAVNSPPL
ncbi:Sec-independent protein translocase subunit TatA [Rhodococcus rhodochrous]|uniref:Sec-independent protein translocase subunit TatA n=1 Tax=Rhodococcus rhodochrous TaxID=1829 RepID=UPI001E2CF83B|nr:Sec-independent protein translocase subunit TatA [Rhodococcus rhodochrous]MCD2098805.1 Sec-independent protein translocase subunit TatA [Rhodococcus rhodochrous]MCD2123317.1 Sec-independent protein translocase subunit TatA [Rhodococcus rhodochrous]MCQ4136047.1 Sec-independent protein translocase subunit TatA [Rhodococcus rhodochrous]MDJ0019969.1 Sec-independent protein translocase subunit TatA [Rhodococcus rhodochrous]